MRNDRFKRLVDDANQVDAETVARTHATIDAALAQARPERRGHWRLAVGIGVAVAALGLTTLGGMTNVRVNHVLAQAPVVGGFFKQFRNGMGAFAEATRTNQKLNATTTSNGITVTVNSAYMEATNVGVSGTVTGLKHVKDDWLSTLAEKTDHDVDLVRTSSGGLHKIGPGKYQFMLTGVVSQAQSKKTLKWPLTFSNFLGNNGTWAYDLVLHPMQGTARALTGSTTLVNGEGKIAILGATDYGNGTTMLKVAEDVKAAQDAINFNVETTRGQVLDVENSDQVEYDHTGKRTVTGFFIKTPPVGTKTLKLRTWYSRTELSNQQLLTGLPATLVAARSHTQVAFTKPTLKNNQLTLRLRVEGGRRSKDALKQLATAIVVMNARGRHENSFAAASSQNQITTYEGGKTGVTTRIVNQNSGWIEVTYDLSTRSGLSHQSLQNLWVQVHYQQINPGIEAMKLIQLK